MKNFLQTTLLVFSLIFIASCSSSDPEPEHIVGDWTLEALNATNLPDTYSSWEGVSYGSAGYEIEILDDGTFVERIKRTGLPSLVLPGLWEYTEDDLILDYTDADDNFTYKVEKNELDQLWLSTPYQDNFVSDANLQVLSDEHGSVNAGLDYLNGLDLDDPDSLAKYNTFVQAVTFDLLYSLIRQE